MDQWLFFDLQLFAGEKTEQATPRRREEARRKGQTFRSVDLNSAVIIIATFGMLYFTFPSMLAEMHKFMAHYLVEGAGDVLTTAVAHAIFLDSITLLAKCTLPIAGAAMIAGIAVNLAQVGFIFSSETLEFKLERIDPIAGFGRIFSKRALVELVKSLSKVAIVGYVVYSVCQKYIIFFPAFMDMGIAQIGSSIATIIFEMAMKVALALLILGLADYFYQRWEYEEGLKMSKQEVKDEYKQMEGDPQIKGKQRQRQREISMRRMMSEVPKADVVITNPTHFAIALKYDSDNMSAPVVIAKGQDFMALKIKEIAKSHNIAVVENPELARAIYYVTEIGDVIPEDLYQAVAEVLAFVYRQKKKIL
ncbi:MAG: flagellar biosynthesis protein FlhB [Acidobacteriota bacterium]